MLITMEQLEEFRKMDIREVNAEDLVQIKTVKINPKDSKEKRFLSYVEQVGNPYFYADGKMVVKISHANNGLTMEDCISDYLQGV